MIFHVLLVASHLLLVTQCQVCYPDEDLEQCAKRFLPDKTAFVRNTSCLGTQKDSLGFLGVCTDNSSHCQAGVYSSSLDCGSGSICCQVKTLVFHNGFYLILQESNKDHNEILPKAQNGW